MSAGGEPTPVATQIAPTTDPMTQINPFYTNQQTDNAFQPLQAYQDFKATGQLPMNQSQFTSFTPAPRTGTPAPRTGGIDLGRLVDTGPDTPSSRFLQSRFLQNVANQQGAK